jgi:hypothetical protein
MRWQYQRILWPLGVALAFFGGRVSVAAPSVGPDRPVAASMDSSGHTAALVATSERHPPRPRAPVQASVPREETQLGAPDPVERATTVVSELRRVLPPGPLALAGGAIRPPSPEARVELLKPYVRGLAAGLRAGDPLVLDALAAEITNELCDAPLVPEQTMLIAQLASNLHEVVTTEGLDCFITRTQGEENSALWDILGAWRESGLEKTSATAELEKTAKDPRTQRALMAPEQLDQIVSAEAERAQVEADRARNAGTAAQVMTNAERAKFATSRSNISGRAQGPTLVREQ